MELRGSSGYSSSSVKAFGETSDGGVCVPADVYDDTRCEMIPKTQKRDWRGMLSFRLPFYFLLRIRT